MPVTGDGQARALTNRLVDAVTYAASGTTATLGGIGIKLERNGTYTFDEATYAAAVAKDPAASAELVSALSTALTAVARQATTNIAATPTSEGSLAITAQGQEAAKTRAARLQSLPGQPAALVAQQAQGLVQLGELPAQPGSR